MTRVARSSWLSLVLLGTGCGTRGDSTGTLTTFGEDGIDVGTDDGDATGTGESPADTGDGDSEAESDSDVDSESTGPKFDLGDEEASDGNAENRDDKCSKVDVVLSVDASSSMAAEIATLPATFVLMKETLATAVGDGITDFRIGVINACPSPPFFHDYAAGDTNCQFPPGRNWLASDDPDIDTQFACVVDIPLQDEALEEQSGINGGYQSQPDYCSDGDDEDEQPGWTAAQSVQPGIAENTDFLRDDAILFVVAITDEDEALATVDSAGEIHDALLFAKGGVDNNVTFLGIGGDDCPSAYDGSNVQDSDHLRDTAESFGERGLYRTMCEGQGADPIAAAFEEALTTIVDAACDEYVPQG